MERIATLIRTLALPVTNQSLADLALQADQERRAAAKRGDRKRAAEHDKESRALASLLR